MFSWPQLYLYVCDLWGKYLFAINTGPKMFAKPQPRVLSIHPSSSWIFVPLSLSHNPVLMDIADPHPSPLLTQQMLTELLLYAGWWAQDRIEPRLRPYELLVDNFVNNVFVSCYFILIPCSKSDGRVIDLIPGYSWVGSSLSPAADLTYCSQLPAERAMVPRQGMLERGEQEGRTHQNNQRYSKHTESLLP